MTSLDDDFSDEEMEESVLLETKRTDDLVACKTVKDAFIKHGLAPDDKIDRREQVSQKKCLGDFIYSW